MSSLGFGKLSEKDVAAVKLLAFAIQRNIKAVKRRYPDSVHLSVFQQVWALTETLVENAEHGQEISVTVYWQPTLFDVSESDDAYSELD